MDLKAVKSVDLDEKVSKKNDKRTPQRENKRKNNEDEEKKKKAKAPSDTKKEKVKSKEPENAPAKTDAPKPAAPIMSLSGKLTPLQQKMMAKLSGSRFRWINEQLYTISSEEALKLVEEQPSLFDEYHQGFRPVNAPGGLPGIVNEGRKQVVIADMGCGEAQLALDVNKFIAQHNKKKKRGGLDIKVHSFDLKKVNDRITVADIKHVPLPDNSCSIVIFCLALMGTNFLDFIKEAYRILAPRGELWIAEIKSRFTESAEARTIKPEDVGHEFVEALKLCGFFHKNTDNSNKMFTRFEFFKPPPDIIEERRAKLERRHKFIEHETEKEELESRRTKDPEGNWLLKPCIYKRR